MNENSAPVLLMETEIAVTIYPTSIPLYLLFYTKFRLAASLFVEDPHSVHLLGEGPKYKRKTYFHFLLNNWMLKLCCTDTTP